MKNTTAMKKSTGLKTVSRGAAGRSSSGRSSSGRASTGSRGNATAATASAILDRRVVVSRILQARTNALVVTGLGSATYDAAAHGDHERNFYLWGAMGGAAMIGLGLALAQPKVPVIVLTGDGEMLMGLGAFATIGLKLPPNLKIVILDNELYGETGQQPTATTRTDLAAVASACGIAQSSTVRSAAQVAQLIGPLHDAKSGTMVAVVKIAMTDEVRALPIRDGAHNRARMRLALGLSVD